MQLGSFQTGPWILENFKSGCISITVSHLGPCQSQINDWVSMTRILLLARCILEHLNLQHLVFGISTYQSCSPNSDLKCAIHWFQGPSPQLPPLNHLHTRSRHPNSVSHAWKYWWGDNGCMWSYNPQVPSPPRGCNPTTRILVPYN